MVFEIVFIVFPFIDRSFISGVLHRHHVLHHHVLHHHVLHRHGSFHRHHDHHRHGSLKHRRHGSFRRHPCYGRLCCCWLARSFRCRR
jgi:hypothetical protein